MKAPWRILHLEDNKKDAELVEATLAAEGVACDVVRVQTRADFLANLEQDGFDMILADYSLPSFDGLAALAIRQEKCPDVPFIFVSGVLGEELAIESLKGGATDYVLKQRLSRLVPSVRRALGEVEERTERRQAEEEVQRHRERQAALHEINQAISSTLDLRTVLDVLLQKIDLALPYAATTIRLFNRQSGLLEPTACRHLDEEEWKADQWRGGRGVPNVVFETKTSVMIGNVQIDPRTRDLEFFRKHGLVSYLGVPLIAKDEVLGVLSFYTKEEYQFGSEEVDFLTTLAGQTAVAIHNSQLYEQTKKQAVELERANRVKDEFLSVMSHELRTPLSVVMGYTRLIRDKILGEINAEQEKALEKIISQAEDQLTMINNMLYATSREAENAKIDRHVVGLRDFMDKLNSTYTLPLNKKVTLIWTDPSDNPLIITDSEKLSVILHDLIDNAIKFTLEGTITISARTIEGNRQEAIGNRWVEFKVADTGIGIPREKILTIFEKFRQIDSSETRLYGGVGIGLYIVKSFTELMGGTVEVESEPGKGSTFTVTIPFERSER